MKALFTKRNLVIWLVVLLLILNVTVIATVLFRKYSQHRIITRPPAEVFKQRPRQGVFLKDELGMTDAQFTKFMDARMKYQNSAQDINKHLAGMKNTYWSEIMKDKPEQKIIEQSCDSIGIFHARLMRETGKYYDEIRQLCKTDQVERLNIFFIRAMQVDSYPMPGRQRLNMTQPRGMRRNNGMNR